jgi:hypothetical protein
MIGNWKKATLLMLGAYWIVTLLVIGFMFVLDAFYHFPKAAELGVSAGQSPAYLATIPFHPLFNLPVWLWFGFLYLKDFAPAKRQEEAWRLGIFWTAICIVKDFIVWVAIPWSWQMTLHEMYVEYQPWLTLIYVVILLAPAMAARLLERRSAQAKA